MVIIDATGQSKISKTMETFLHKEEQKGTTINKVRTTHAIHQRETLLFPDYFRF